MTLCLGVLTSFTVMSQTPQQSHRAEIFPTEQWLHYKTPEQAGFIPQRLAKVENFYHKKDFAGLLVVKNGAVVLDWGENRRRFLVHSIRKSMLSALYGIHYKEMDLESTLADLNIDDNGRLTAQERTARVVDILASRSGIYLPAAAEGGQMVENRPERGSYAAGSHWWYNNWDFNVAGSIYTLLTGEEIAQAFTKYIATPLAMQDFRAIDGYVVKANSQHVATQFRMSSRDLARMGLLYARNGNWLGQQIISPDWIAQSTQAVSETQMGNQYPPYYGYMWWVEDDGSFSARGAGGHILAVYPERDMVVVLRTNTYLEQSVSAKAIKKILQGIVSASEGQLDPDAGLVLAQENQPELRILPPRFQHQALTIPVSDTHSVTLHSNNNRMFVNLGTGDLELEYISDNAFAIIDRQEPLTVALDETGKIKDFATPRRFYLHAAHAAQQGDLDKALHWVGEVQVMLPESAIAYTNMAKIYLAQGNIEDTKTMLAEALKYDPQNRQAKGLHQTLLLKQWGLPIVIALGAAGLLLLFTVLRKRRRR